MYDKRLKYEVVAISILTLVSFFAVPTLAQQLNSGLAPNPDQLSTDIKELRLQIEKLRSQNLVRDIGPTVVGLLGLIGSIVIAVKSLNRNADLTRRTLQEKAYEEERKMIRDKRDRFYGPLIQLRGISRQLYSIFTARRTTDEKSKFADSDGNYRTLIALCRGHIFEGIDKTILDEIVKIGETIESLISKEVGMIEDKELQEELWRLSAHHRIIRLALEGKFKGAGKEVEGFTFPHEVDSKIQVKIDALNRRLNELASVK